MINIHDDILSAEPVDDNNGWHHVRFVNGGDAAVYVFPDTDQVSAEASAMLAGRLQHLVDAYDAAIPRVRRQGLTKIDARPFIETEWVDGIALKDKWGLSDQGSLPSQEVFRAMEQLARILTFAHRINLVHGNIRLRNLLWDQKRSRYALVNFDLGSFADTGEKFDPAGPDVLSAQHQMEEGKQKDISDAGALFYRLLTGKTWKAVREKELRSSLEKTLAVTVPPASVPWVATALYRSLTGDAGQRYHHVGELYDAVIKNNLSVSTENKFYRSRPQQVGTAPVTRSWPRSVFSPAVLPGEARSLKRWVRPKVNPWVAVSIVAVIGIAIWLLMNQGKVSSNQDNELAATRTSAQAIDTGMAYASDTPRIVTEKPVTKKPKKPAKKPLPTVTVDSAANAPAEVENPSGTVYTVRSKAYFHNSPDASTRRNAFIVHWNKARLKPLDEKNGFVYIEYTNVEGQTSKGWIAKKDLRKVGE